MASLCCFFFNGCAVFYKSLKCSTHFCKYQMQIAQSSKNLAFFYLGSAGKTGKTGNTGKTGKTVRAVYAVCAVKLHLSHCRYKIIRIWRKSPYPAYISLIPPVFPVFPVSPVIIFDFKKMRFLLFFFIFSQEKETYLQVFSGARKALSQDP